MSPEIQKPIEGIDTQKTIQNLEKRMQEAGIPLDTEHKKKLDTLTPASLAELYGKVDVLIQLCIDKNNHISEAEQAEIKRILNQHLENDNV